MKGKLNELKHSGTRWSWETLNQPPSLYATCFKRKIYGKMFFSLSPSLITLFTLYDDKIPGKFSLIGKQTQNTNIHAHRTREKYDALDLNSNFNLITLLFSQLPFLFSGWRLKFLPWKKWTFSYVTSLIFL